MSPVQLPVHDSCNEVHLVGRVIAEPDVTVTRGGREFVTAVLAVPRPRPPAGRGRRSTADTITCTAWTADVRRRVRSWCKDDIVEVRGALRRRVWHTDKGSISRYDIELNDVAVLQAVPVAGHDTADPSADLHELFPVAEAPDDVTASIA